jgi:hypothetical protein
MAKQNNRRTIDRMLVALLITLAISFVGTAVWFRGAREQVSRAASNLQECERLAQQIEVGADQPQLAGLESHSENELSQRAETAAAACGIPVASLASIIPMSERRIGDSAYQEQPSRIEITAVTLSQLYRFLEALKQGATGMRVAAIGLTAPPSNAGNSEERWNVDVTLTHLIYAPKS